MFVPNAVMAFGSSYKKFTIKIASSAPSTYYKYVKIDRTHMRYLDNPNDRCTNEGTDMTSCIAEYIANKIGCSVKIQGIESHMFQPCKNGTEWEAFVNVSQQLEQAGATDVYKMTGCLSACEKYKYDSSLENWSEGPSHSNRYNQLLLIFTIYERSYIEEEQYVIYDENSFLADIGGFLGLVLGSSLLNLFDEVVGLLGGLKIDMV